MSKRNISRRQFLIVSGTAAAGLALSACGEETPTEAPEEQAPEEEAPEEVTEVTEEEAPEEEAPEEEAPSEEEEVSEGKYKEAPVLAEMVAAGELEPVDDRLPVNPLVVEPTDSIGKYGGVWTSGTIETNGNDLRRNIGYEKLVRWTPAWDGVIPNVCESHESNEEGTEYTFNLREGLKWSDGEPYTADDILFWYEDVRMNEELNPVEPKPFFKIEKVDDYTIKWIFDEPQGLFIKEFAQIQNRQVTRHPKHYLQQFHIEYNPEADQLAQDEGFASWSELFMNKELEHENADLPRLWAWVPTVGLSEASSRVTCERNPYYFKVDPEGQQLPYIDTYRHELAGDNEVLVLKGLNGELDFQEQWINALENRSVFYDNQEKGGYSFWELTPTYAGACIIMLNRDCTDPVKAELFSNKDFRIGLSYAMNRQELVDVVMVGQSEPAQGAPRPESPYYHERLAKQYTEYDVDKANEHLDKAGYAEKDENGWRLGPDGNPISFVLEIDQGRTEYVDMLELIKPRWEEVGIQMNLKLMERSLWEERCRGRNLEFHGSAHKFGGGGGEAVLLDPRYWFPNGYSSCIYAKSWGAWYQNRDDEIAKEPPDDVKAIMSRYDDLYLTSDPEKQTEIIEDVLDMSADQFFHIGTVLEPPMWGIVTNRMRNTPESIPLSWIYPTPNPANTHQFYIEE